MSSKNVKRSDDLRAENRFRLLQLLRQHGNLTRTDLAVLSGLSQGSLTTMCGELTDEGIINCTFPAQNGRARRGRPLSNFQLAPDQAVSATVSVTLDSITTSLLDYAGNTLENTATALQTSHMTTSSLTQQIREQIDKSMVDKQHHLLKHIAVSLQGPTNSDTGVLVRSPILPIEDAPIADHLATLYNVPVSINNDCKYIASALYQSKRSVLGENFAAVTVTYGVGMGLYINGRPIKGASSSGLELGHVIYQRNGAKCRCGNNGCIEAYAATYAIRRHALGGIESTDDQSEAPEKHLCELIQSAKNGSSKAHEAFAIAGSALGSGVATVFTMFDPMPVAIIGYGKDTWEFMAEDFFATLHEATMGDHDFTKLIHNFGNSDSLRLQGLAAESLKAVDHEFAYRNTRARMSDQLPRERPVTEAGPKMH